MKSSSFPFVQPLLDWYGSNRRPLPWRDRQDDPYAIWVSEIMLQQTTVGAVIPFYNRWMARFPTVNALAAASMDDVLFHWTGLGYYARARNLKRAAEHVATNLHGRLPGTVEELIRLPGIGRYTAGAISSIAFNQNAPILDANVVRVLTRLFALTGDPKISAGVQKTLWHLAETSIPHGQARDYNQSLMELGALVCTPAAPRCNKCPVFNFCLARAKGDPTEYPQFSQTKKWLDVQHSAALVEQNENILVVQRPLDQLWGGLWELPRVTVAADESPAAAAARGVFETAALSVSQLRPFGVHKHVVTNRRVLLHGFTAHVVDPPIAATDEPRTSMWVNRNELEHLAMSSPQRALLALWETNRGQAKLDI